MKDDKYISSKHKCSNCGYNLLIWPDTIDEDRPPDGLNWDTNEFCPTCHFDQNLKIEE